MPSPYDTVAYPTIIHKGTQPERLAMAARLFGLDPVPMNEARVLEIGGGTCFGLMSFAATWPGSRCHGFDLAASPIAHGQRLAAGDLPNLTLAVDDIMTAHEHLQARSFDYVIAHGVYAWVPQPVRRTLLDLIGHVLSDRGVAFVSYNALPGGHIRMILRDTVLHAVAGAANEQERMERAYAFLHSYAEPQENDEPMMVGIRRHAAEMIKRPAGVLFHDEMGDIYAPQSLTQACADAARAGLRFLTDAGRDRGLDGLLAPDVPDPVDADIEVIRAAQARDYLELCFFRASLFVPDRTHVGRRLNPAAIDGLWLSTDIKPLGDGKFQDGDATITVPDPELAKRLEDLTRLWPARAAVADLAQTEDQRRALIGLWQGWYANFYEGPPPYAVTPGERPEVGKWIRGMLERGESMVASLDHRAMRIDQPDLRALLLAADGTRTLAQLATMDHGIPAYEVGPALAHAGRCGLLSR